MAALVSREPIGEDKSLERFVKVKDVEGILIDAKVFDAKANEIRCCYGSRNDGLGGWLGSRLTVPSVD